MRKFIDKQDCTNYLTLELNSAGMSSELSIPIAERIADCFRDDGAFLSRSTKGFGLLLRKYVIRDDDLKLFESFKNGFIAFASIGFLSSSINVSSVAALAFSIFEIARNSLNRGVRITQVQFIILSILKYSHKRLTIHEIYDVLHKNPIATASDIDKVELKRELNRLAGKIPRMGNAVSLVFEDSDGRWGVVSI
jgi:hypothetical protein